MKKVPDSFLLILVLFVCTPLLSIAQKATLISISGEVSTPSELTKESLAVYKSISLKTKDKDGKKHEYRGVTLVDVLEKAGVTLGGKLRGENLMKVVVIEATDGYKVVYTLPELDPEFTNNTVLLATEKDGVPLPENEGPFRLVAPQDKKQARWVRQIRSIRVVLIKN